MKKNRQNHVSISKDSDRLEKNKDFVRVEGFNALRSNVRICLKKDSHNKILVTSPRPGDGKSTCSCNLAISFANAGKSVLLIDCDLRKAAIHRTFGLSNRKGLTDVLSKLSSIELCIQETEYNNLSILSAGSKVPNPSEMLSGSEMKELLDKLEEKYDYIIIDSPPINVVSDSVPMFAWIDGIVLVVRANKTHYKDLNEALATIKFADANLFGLFFYDKPMQKRRYYYRYGSRYGSYSRYGNYSNYDRDYGESDKGSVI